MCHRENLIFLSSFVLDLLTKQLHGQTFGLEIYYDTFIMRSHSIPDVETFDQSVALDTGTAQRDVSGKKIV